MRTRDAERVGKIVVGIDGSAAAADALAWAYAQARLTGSELVVVHCWEYPYLGTIDFAGFDENIRATARGGAETLLNATVDRLRADHPGDDVTLAPLLLEGNPAWTLLDTAKDADLVVVGSRGRSGLKTLLLGSVSHVVVNHAETPVVVVRSRAAANADPADHADGE